MPEPDEAFAAMTPKAALGPTTGQQSPSNQPPAAHPQWGPPISGPTPPAPCAQPKQQTPGYQPVSYGSSPAATQPIHPTAGYGVTPLDAPYGVQPGATQQGFVPWTPPPPPPRPSTVGLMALDLVLAVSLGLFILALLVGADYHNLEAQLPTGPFNEQTPLPYQDVKLPGRFLQKLRAMGGLLVIDLVCFIAGIVAVATRRGRKPGAWAILMSIVGPCLGFFVLGKALGL